MLELYASFIDIIVGKENAGRIGWSKLVSLKAG